MCRPHRSMVYGGMPRAITRGRTNPPSCWTKTLRVLGFTPTGIERKGIVGRLGLADDFIGPHHFVVFVLENVAMPDVAEFISRVYLRSRWEIEAGDHTRDVT